MTYLAHHGILGMKWGVENGPPYPIASGNHSASEKRAGWRNSLHKNSSSNPSKQKVEAVDNSKRLPYTIAEKQKKIVEVGVAIALSALTVYGAYRIGSAGYSDDIINIGKEFTKRSLGDSENTGALKFQDVQETLDESLRRTNPFLKTADGANNCTYCSITGFLRRHGYDVTANGTDGEMQNLAGVVDLCFKNATIFDGSATKFGKSRKDAGEMLVKRFGNNAEGVCQIQWKNTDRGHAFNWQIEDGNVSFFDFQVGRKEPAINRYFSLIDPNGGLILARLDGLEINLETIRQVLSDRT